MHFYDLSEPKLINISVLQDRILGPLLFLSMFYINPQIFSPYCLPVTPLYWTQTKIYIIFLIELSQCIVFVVEMYTGSLFYYFIKRLLLFGRLRC